MLWPGAVTIAVLTLCFVYISAKYIDDDDPAYVSTDPSVREPRPCEVCKYLVTELAARLEKSGKSSEVLEIGHQVDRKKKRVPYKYSELRLIDALHEPHICENILKYNVHAEREGSLRYGKGESETMQTLKGLVNKGVKVELGIPNELWDEPSAEVTKMHRACFNLVEKYEDDIEDWYYNHQDEDLSQFICGNLYLKDKNANPACLTEVVSKKGKSKKAGKKKKNKDTKLKGETGDLKDEL